MAYVSVARVVCAFRAIIADYLRRRLTTPLWFFSSLYFALNRARYKSVCPNQTVGLYKQNGRCNAEVRALGVGVFV